MGEEMGIERIYWGMEGIKCLAASREFCVSLLEGMSLLVEDSKSEFTAGRFIHVLTTGRWSYRKGRKYFF